MSKIIRWFLQFLLAGFLVLSLLFFVDLIIKGEKPYEIILFVSGIALFVGLIWLTKFIGDPTIRTKEGQAKFHSLAYPILRRFNLIIATLILISFIINLISG